MGKLGVAFSLASLFLPESVQRLIWAGRLPVVDGRRIDPSAMALSHAVAKVRSATGTPSLTESRAQIEMMAEKFDMPCPASVSRLDVSLPGADGDLVARLYTPSGVGEDAPLLLYLHGGGWVQGNPDTHDGLCGRLAEQARIRVVSLDYRLAPEHPFPAAPDDALAAYRGLLAGIPEIPVVPERMAVGGDSAGGNLTAALMHDLSAAGDPLPAAQLLIYPAVDARLNSASMVALAEQPLLPLTRIRWYMDQYLPEGVDRMQPRVSPLFSEHLEGQPPAFIVVGGHDPLWSDALAYADALKAAGVRTTLAPYEGQVHAFVSLSRIVPQADHAIQACAMWLHRTLGAQ